MLLEVERDKAITDRVILLQKVIRGFKDRYVPGPAPPHESPPAPHTLLTSFPLTGALKISMHTHVHTYK